MTKFCPYCGKALNDRSRFCSHCGRAAPDRRTAALAIEDAGRAGERDSAGGAHAFTTGRLMESAPDGGVRTRVAGRGNGAAAGAARRYAPPTHALIGSSEQAGFGLRYGAWMFDFLVTLIAMMVFTFAVTAASHRSV